MEGSQGSSGQDIDHNKVSNLLEEINDESSMNMKSSCNFITDRLATESETQMSFVHCL